MQQFYCDQCGKALSEQTMHVFVLREISLQISTGLSKVEELSLCRQHAVELREQMKQQTTWRDSQTKA